MSDWVTVACVAIMAILGVTQLYVMEQYIVEFRTLKDMYDTLVQRVNDVLAHTTEVIDNDRLILNDVKREKKGETE